jgi:hypothetical protein
MEMIRLELPASKRAARARIGGGATMSGKGTVLVTGGSGFIGSWCVIELLR